MVPPRRIELPTPPLPIVYSLTIVIKNRQKLVLLGNAKPKCALSFRNFRSFSAHFGMAFLRRNYDILAVQISLKIMFSHLIYLIIFSNKF